MRRIDKKANRPAFAALAAIFLAAVALVTLYLYHVHDLRAFGGWLVALAAAVVYTACVECFSLSLDLAGWLCSRRALSRFGWYRCAAATVRATLFRKNRGVGFTFALLALYVAALPPLYRMLSAFFSFGMSFTACLVSYIALLTALALLHIFISLVLCALFGLRGRKP